MSETVQQKTSEYPKVLGKHPDTGCEMIQIDERTVMLDGLEFHMVPEELIAERGTGRWTRRNGFRGIRGMRYEFMLNEMPLEAQRMDFSGEMEPYLTQIENAWNARVGELMEDWLDEQIASGTLPEGSLERMQLANNFHQTAREIATHEFILNKNL